VSNRWASSPLEKSLIINLVLLSFGLNYRFILFNAFHFSLIGFIGQLLKLSFEPGIGLLLVLLLENFSRY
jgi:hypothetical protein